MTISCKRCSDDFTVFGGTTHSKICPQCFQEKRVDNREFSPEQQATIDEIKKEAEDREDYL